MSPYDKGKILAYMEIFNITQIAKKMGRDPTTIHRFINKYKETRKFENLPRTIRPSQARHATSQKPGRNFGTLA